MHVPKNSKEEKHSTFLGQLVQYKVPRNFHPFIFQSPQIFHFSSHFSENCQPLKETITFYFLHRNSTSLPVFFLHPS